MDKDEITAWLKDNLSVQLSTSTESNWGSKGFIVKVELLLGDEVISTSKDSLDLEIRDTRDTWRSTFD